MIVHSYCRKCGGLVEGRLNPSDEWFREARRERLLVQRYENGKNPPLGEGCTCEEGEVKSGSWT